MTSRRGDYRIQFPVMRMYELADEFDARGRRLRNTTRKDQGGTPFRAARQAAAEHFPKAYRTRSAEDALSPDWPFTSDFTATRIRQLESLYGPGRIPLMLDVRWDVDDSRQTVTKTFFPPFTKVDREADDARAWDEFSLRYSGQQVSSGQFPVSSEEPAPSGNRKQETGNSAHGVQS